MKAFPRQSGIPVYRPANGQSVLLGHLKGHSGEQGGAVAASPQVTGPGSHCSSTSLGGYKTSLRSRTHRAKETLKLVLDFESRLGTCQLVDLWQVPGPL